jgi:lipid-binding SYLF domain-containing protein
MHAQHVSRNWFSRVAVCLLVAAFSVAAVAGERQDTRLTTSTRVLTELMMMPEQNIPTWLLERAHAVAVIPAVIKVGLGVGARRGKGVLVVRRDNGDWSNPIFVNLTGGSFGFQVGVQSTDVVLVFTSPKSVEGIVGGKVTLGADASVAAGPVGRQTAAATDVGLSAVYSYSRASGLFAGVALDGSAMTIDDASNEAFYSRPGVLASEIIRADAPAAPQPAGEFIAALERSTHGVAAANAAPRTTSGQVATAPTGSTAASPQDSQSKPAQTFPLEDENPGEEPPE